MGDLVRVRLNGVELNVGRGHAEASGLEILEDESAYRGDGSPRRTTRANGRPVLPATSVAKEAAKKKAPTSGAAKPEEATE